MNIAIILYMCNTLVCTNMPYCLVQLQLSIMFLAIKKCFGVNSFNTLSCFTNDEWFTTSDRFLHKRFALGFHDM